MAKGASAAAGAQDRQLEDELVGRIYDVAVDPLNYGDLLDVWEELMAPERRRSPRSNRLSFPGPEISSHFSRLAAILDRSGAVLDGNADALLAAYPRVAAFCIDEHLGIRAVNQPGRVLFGLQAGMPLSELPLCAPDLTALTRSVRACLAGSDGRAPLLRLALDATEPDKDGTADRDEPRPLLVRLHRVEDGEGRKLVRVVTSELLWPPALDDTLARSFGLTASEIDVLRGLSRSLSPREIAVLRGRSVETVRAQVKSLLQKTSTRSQGDVVRLALSAMDVSDPATAKQSTGRRWSGGSGSNGIAPSPFRTLERPEGRRMEYLVLGDPRGRPVLYFCGVFGFCRLPAAAEADLARRGIRLIVPVRPGYGGSDPLPRDVDRLQATAGDMAAVARAEGATRLPALVVQDDMLHAAALHRDHPEMLDAILGIAAGLPVTRPEQFDRMGKWHRFVYSAARYTPHLLRPMIRVGIAMVSNIGKKSFLDTVLRQSRSDMAHLRSPHTFEAMQVGSEITLSANRTAFEAMVREFALTHAPESRELVDGLRDGPPVRIFSGPDDMRLPPETLAEMQEDYPWIEFVKSETGGSLLLFDRWDRVTEMIDDMLSRELPQMGDVPDSGQS